jgi:hypothetical protein
MPKDTFYIFIPWYTERDWKEVSRLTYGSPNHCGDYNKWVKRCEKEVIRLRANGAGVQKVFIKAEEYENYCKEKKLKCNAKTRLLFVESKISESSKMN